MHAPAAPRDDPHEPPLPWVLEPGGGVFTRKLLSASQFCQKLFVFRALIMFRLTLLSWFPRLRKTVTPESFGMLAEDFSEF